MTTSSSQLREGCVVIGSLFNEPMRVETMRVGGLPACGETQAGGRWVAGKIFAKRIPHTVDFQMDGPEFDLYREITRFSKRQSDKAAAQDDPPRQGGRLPVVSLSA